jgi:hypothetical protein
MGDPPMPPIRTEEAFDGVKCGLHRGHVTRESPTSEGVGFRFWPQHGHLPNTGMNKLMKVRCGGSVPLRPTGGIVARVTNFTDLQIKFPVIGLKIPVR